MHAFRCEIPVLLCYLFADSTSKVVSANKQGTGHEVESADFGLIASCQQGDHRAFRQIFDIYRDRVYGLCRQMSDTDEDAEDLTQEIFIQVFRSIRSFRGEAALGTWIFRVAANVCTSELRKRRPKFQSLADAESANDLPAANQLNPEEQLVRKELVKRVEEAVSALPPSQRLVFVLATQMNMRYREIGEVVGYSEDAVKVRIHPRS